MEKKIHVIVRVYLTILYAQVTDLSSIWRAKRGNNSVGSHFINEHLLYNVVLTS